MVLGFRARPSHGGGTVSKSYRSRGGHCLAVSPARGRGHGAVEPARQSGAHHKLSKPAAPCKANDIQEAVQQEVVKWQKVWNQDAEPGNGDGDLLPEDANCRGYPNMKFCKRLKR